MGERRGTKALELWCRRMTDGYPGVKIDNMTTSWRDGLAFCAMIHHFRPDLIEFEKLNKKDIYHNNDLAFRTAERHLGIPALLDADDMATYEVPDRLSILTYLSQFYQVFASQDSPNRLKRPSTSTEQSAITKSQGPPAKMAHVVGVPKRDPCQKCNLPVFLAERLSVGKCVYHRTCLKCARCGSQLTPGSFYETETDGEYCCETCPDEETTIDIEPDVNLRSQTPDSLAVKSKTPTRSSIAERLAFFEQSKDLPTNTSRVHQKSISDEEKSRSLKKMTLESPVSYKMNSALSSFINSTLADQIDGDAGTSKLAASMTAISSSESGSDNEANDESDDLPELPTSLPPLLPDSDSEESDLGSRLQSSNYSTEPEEKDIIHTSTSGITLKPSDGKQTIDDTDINMEDDATFEESISTTSIIASPENGLNLSKSNSNIVTKDNNEPDEQMRTTNAITVDESSSLHSTVSVDIAMQSETQTKKDDDAQSTLDQRQPETQETHDSVQKPPLRQRPSTLDIKANATSSELKTDKSEDEETTNRLSVVRARLHQFEVIANNITNNDKTPENSASVSTSRIKSDSSSRNETVTPSKQKEDEMAVDQPLPNVQKSTSPSDDTQLKQNANEVPTLQATESGLEIAVPTIEDTNIVHPTLEDDQNVTHTPVPDDTLQETISKEEQYREVNNVEHQEPIKAKEQHPESSTTKEKQQETTTSTVSKQDIEQPGTVTTNASPAKVDLSLYPEELNPFASDDEDGDNVAPLSATAIAKPVIPTPKPSFQISTPPPPTGNKLEKEKGSNPFDSSDDEIEIEKKVKPPRPPPPKISKNPFGSESEDGGDENYSSLANVNRKPVPTPRSNASLSQNPTPEPTPRLSSRQQNYISPLNNSSDFYGSNSSLGSTPYSLQRNIDGRGSNNSLASSVGTIRSRKSRKGPAPQPPVKELFPSNETLDSKVSSPSSSNSATPNQGRKKRLAPAPPKPARLHETISILVSKPDNNDTGPKNLLSYPLQSDLDKLSDEEKALLEGNRLEPQPSEPIEDSGQSEEGSKSPTRRLILLDHSFVEDTADLIKQKEEEVVFCRRRIVPDSIVIDGNDDSVSYDRQLEKLKDNKEAQNRNRQSQISLGAEDQDPLYNKSSHGKWKRRKGPAPALPIPPRKVLQMLPLQEIRHELDIIEVQQQGLEKQGVILEKMIRDRCEGKDGTDGGPPPDPTAVQEPNSKEVEDLILQLFELVNEKNELFRRQAELMYLRRQHRLEQEQADLEYEIRVLMAQPERNKTDSDKAREEALIARLVEVVQLRNDVVDCLEMDRLREAEEDLSIKQRLELHSAKREQKKNRSVLSKLSKKEKKKQEEAKKLGKSKKLDADKDADESEVSTEKQRTKKKKKKFLF